jgi:hypothetical protein
MPTYWPCQKLCSLCLHVCIGNQVMMHQFRVIHGLPNEIILGMDFIYQHCLCYDPVTHTLPLGVVPTQDPYLVLTQWKWQDGTPIVRLMGDPGAGGAPLHPHKPDMLTWGCHRNKVHPSTCLQLWSQTQPSPKEGHKGCTAPWWPWTQQLAPPHPCQTHYVQNSLRWHPSGQRPCHDPQGTILPSRPQNKMRLHPLKGQRPEAPLSMNLVPALDDAPTLDKAPAQDNNNPVTTTNNKGRNPRAPRTPLLDPFGQIQEASGPWNP